MKTFAQILREWTSGPVPQPSPEDWDRAEKRAMKEFESTIPNAKKLAKKFKGKIKIHKNEQWSSSIANFWNWIEIDFGRSKLKWTPHMQGRYYMTTKGHGDDYDIFNEVRYDGGPFGKKHIKKTMEIVDNYLGYHRIPGVNK